ncbi:MAG TPA: Cthe_2314 family HEPN domain-containing protein, partial [Chitinophagaceae bacterium]|nr:Cthe_2314 family HEPN domain-containing protein [Chitinophagaceae bacterium]
YGREIFPNHQNIEAKRYNMFADIVSQKTYNYWDRIGDLIASFFPDRIKPNQVYFSSAIECIPAEFHSSDNYIWLNDFKTTEYNKLNSLRRQIVHYTTTDTDYRHRHLQVKDRETMELLQSERESLPEYYKRQIKLSLDGFEKTMQLFEEFNSTLFADKEESLPLT